MFVCICVCSDEWFSLCLGKVKMKGYISHTEMNPVNRNANVMDRI